MKVHYRKRIADRIIEEITKAGRQNREVEIIELNDSEWMRFKHELACPSGPSQGRKLRPSQAHIEFMGVTVVKEEAGFIDDEDGEF